MVSNCKFVVVTADLAFSLLDQHKQDQEDMSATQAQARDATQQVSFRAITTLRSSHCHDLRATTVCSWVCM